MITWLLGIQAFKNLDTEQSTHGYQTRNFINWNCINNNCIVFL